MTSEKSHDRADERHQKIQSKHHGNQQQTTIEDAGSGLLLCEHERIRRFVMCTGELLMNGPLNAIKPLSNLNVVVTADVEQHEPSGAGALDQKFDGYAG